MDKNKSVKIPDSVQCSSCRSLPSPDSHGYLQKRTSFPDLNVGLVMPHRRSSVRLKQRRKTIRWGFELTVCRLPLALGWYTSVQQNCVQAGSPHILIDPETLTSQQNHQNDESGIRTHALSDQICSSTGSETLYTALVWRLRPLGHLTMSAVLWLHPSLLCYE